MPKFFIRGDHGQIIGEKQGAIFTMVIAGTSYRFGEADDTITELSSGWKVPGRNATQALSNLHKAHGDTAKKFAEAVRIGAKLAAQWRPLPPLPLARPTLPPLPGARK